MCQGEIVRKIYFILFTNKLVFSESVTILTRHLLIRRVFRMASLRIMIIMKEFLFSVSFLSLSSNLKLSIDIFIMSVRHAFAEFRLIFVKRSCSRPRRQKAHVFFLYFIKAQCFVDIVSAHK